MSRSATQFAAVVLLVGLASSASSGATQEAAITVTTRADAMNGDVRSVQNLLANPGPDGISLREAIEATNNDPGPHTIGFAPNLRGATISVRDDLPYLRGGGLTVDGDVTGDGRPDITLRNGRAANGPGLTVVSGGNTLRALAIQGFSVGVAFVLDRRQGELPSGETFAGNTISALAITGARNGIYFGPSGICERRACATRNTWRDLRIVGNTIEASTGGVTVHLFGSVGDRLEGVTIERNTVRVPRRTKCVVGGNAIDVTAGAGAIGERRNRISDVVVSGNVVTGGAMAGIRVAAGSDGSDANVVERVRVLGNRIDLQPARTNTCSAQQIVIITGDYARNQAGLYANDNVLRDVEVSRNSLKGNEGIRVFSGGAGGARNVIRDLRIARNSMVVIGPFPGVNVNGGQGGVDRVTTDGRISDVVVEANRIVIRKTDTDLLRPPFGGISFISGEASGFRNGVRGARIERVRISDNVIDTTLVGISLIAGFAFTETEGLTSGNALVDVVVSSNRILRAPAPNESYEKGARGIRVVGGIGNARGNRVACVRVSGNRVGGVRDAVSIAPNASPSSAPGATGNRATLRC